MFSMRPLGNLAWKQQSLRMCAASHSTPPSMVKGSTCDQSWASPHLELWASYGSDFRVHSWVDIHLPEACMEKKILLLDSQIAQGAFTALRLLCFVKVLSNVHTVCWN